MGSWLAQYFFNPSFVLPGAALVAAPIIIHLINRLRFRRVRFAAMEFLLQSEQQNRRRILMEQLLLLLLRVLIVLAAVALISRLILDPAQMSLFRGARAHHVVLLDDSGSMLDQQSDGTAFDEALGVVRKLVSEGARRPDTQRFTLVLLSRPDEPLFADRDVNEAFLNELAAKLENARSTHQSLELLDGLKAAERLFADERAMVRQLHVLSAFRCQDWIDEQATVSVCWMPDRIPRPDFVQ